MGKVQLDGQRFGKLLVIERVDTPDSVKDKKRNSYWRCRCDCGNETIVQLSSLRMGRSKSCGCVRIETLKNQTGNKNPAWRGDEVSNKPLHRWIAKIKHKPDVCEWCYERSKIELSFDHELGKHTRNPDDYLWLCDSCHALRDKGQDNVKPLTKERVHRIREFYKVGASNLTELGKMFCVTKQTISNIINHKYCYQEEV